MSGEGLLVGCLSVVLEAVVVSGLSGSLCLISFLCFSGLFGLCLFFKQVWTAPVLLTYVLESKSPPELGQRA